MRSSGIPVEVLVEYVSLFQHGKDSRETRIKILTEQRDILAVKVSEMQKTLEKLDFKIANYDELVFEAEKNCPNKGTKKSWKLNKKKQEI